DAPKATQARLRALTGARYAVLFSFNRHYARIVQAGWEKTLQAPTSAGACERPFVAAGKKTSIRSSFISRNPDHEHAADRSLSSNRRNATNHCSGTRLLNQLFTSDRGGNNRRCQAHSEHARLSRRGPREGDRSKLPPGSFRTAVQYGDPIVRYHRRQ